MGYLDEHLGSDFIECLKEVSIKRPEDPLQFIIEFLENKVKEEKGTRGDNHVSGKPEFESIGEKLNSNINKEFENKIHIGKPGDSSRRLSSSLPTVQEEINTN